MLFCTALKVLCKAEDFFSSFKCHLSWFKTNKWVIALLHWTYTIKCKGIISWYISCLDSVILYTIFLNVLKTCWESCTRHQKGIGLTMSLYTTSLKTLIANLRWDCSYIVIIFHVILELCPQLVQKFLDENQLKFCRPSCNYIYEIIWGSAEGEGEFLT